MNTKHSKFTNSIKENNPQKSAYQKLKNSFYAQKGSLKFYSSNENCYDGYFDIGDDTDDDHDGPNF